MISMSDIIIGKFHWIIAGEVRGYSKRVFYSLGRLVSGRQMSASTPKPNWLHVLSVASCVPYLSHPTYLYLTDLLTDISVLTAAALTAAALTAAALTAAALTAASHTAAALTVAAAAALSLPSFNS